MPFFSNFDASQSIRNLHGVTVDHLTHVYQDFPLCVALESCPPNPPFTSVSYPSVSENVSTSS